MTPELLKEAGLSEDDRRVRQTLALAQEIEGFPRHLSIHVGGFVITREPLVEMIPVENAAMKGRTVVQWEKDDLDAVGVLKVDLLGLGMLTALAKCLRADQGAPRARAVRWPRFRRRIRRSTTCCATRTRSGCSRSRAGRR